METPVQDSDNEDELSERLSVLGLAEDREKAGLDSEGKEEKYIIEVSEKDLTKLKKIKLRDYQLESAEKTSTCTNTLACDNTVSEDIVPTEIKNLADINSVPLYLKLLESGSEKKRDIRLVTVGMKGTGKTSLLKRLFGEEISMVKEVASTNGIEIHKIKCKANFDDGKWNKLDGNNEESDLHARLLKPYEEKLKNIPSSVKVVAREAIQNTSSENFDESMEYEAASLQPNPQVTDQVSTISHELQLSVAVAAHEAFQSTSAENIDESKESESTSSQPNLQVPDPVATTSHELPANVLLQQAYSDIKTMLKSKVDLYDKEEYATLFLWDFAGDEEFYHTHQTFLSPDAIYLVVTKLNEADDKKAQDLFRLWIDSIHCYSRLEEDKQKSAENMSASESLDPPVVIVGTWKDAVTSESEEIEDSYRENILMYTKNMAEDERGHIRNEVFISNTEDDNNVFQKIRKDILKLARTMRTWNIDYPLKFIQLEKRLQEKKKDIPIIDFQELKHICTETPMPLKDEELILFLKFHHEIRALVYFQDLPDYIILDTQWLSNVFKCIVTAKKFRAVSIKNQKRWEEFHSKGKLHTVVLEDILRKEEHILYKHKDHIVNVMEKFDIIIRPIKSDRYPADERLCYYVPCMIMEKPGCDIYEMFNVADDTCKKSTWICFKFRFLPPHLMNHLIASLCREYEVSEVGITEQGNKQVERVIALFKGTAVFELEKTRKLRKLLVTTCPNIIQMQILEFGRRAIITGGMYKHIADFVTEEINKIISTRFRMTNVNYEKKWECGIKKPEFVTGSFAFTEEQNPEYYCETCIETHMFIGEWSDIQSNTLCLSQSSDDAPKSNHQAENKVFLTKMRCSFQGSMETLSKLSGESVSTGSMTGFTKEEINFAKMGMIVLNILADVLYDLLKKDTQNLRPRLDCDITFLYSEIRKLNKHIPTNSWGGQWQIIQKTDIAIGDDVERVRLTRNELQHSRNFTLNDTRFNELKNIILDLVNRFNLHNKPTKLYSDHLNEILSTSVSADDVKILQNQIKNEVKTEMAFEVEIEQQINVSHQ
ncbi:uncharacterized protein LOC143072066 [Mytilus galloprovincialis]|uniref:uncharacterized protein LOC143072066 n=1 Tax=Mytilus galloprovincialis TaxID=29158 RepID=UPI003F7B414E